LKAIPGIVYPRIPGHELIGVIDALGRQVEGWTIGERVGVGWLGSRGDGLAARPSRRPPRRAEGGVGLWASAS
jgi:NADPH:quinone reductase-like Zn-dependent oxidoreductase